MIRINNVKIPLDYDRETLLKAAAKELRVEPKAIRSVSLFRRSVDARKKEQMHFICTLDAEVAANENALLKKAKNAVRAAPYRYNIPQWRGGAQPVVVGFGPAGMFAALVLAQSGACPIVVERGKDVDSRTADVDRFWLTGKLDTTSNVQFGEGGAGTFSDGKLNTGTKDSRQRKVLDEFVAHGAPEEILYNAKPHIGTDKLKLTVRQIREEIISRGGKVLFETKLTGFEQRDTFEMLCNKGLPMEAKPFSVGARIEHLREEIDRAQYGKFAGHPALGAASYKMNVHTKNGRGAYTFCMCPGGKVVNASSEEGRLCTNGMSEFARDATNSNAALLVSVSPADFGGDGPLDGMYYQRRLEGAVTPSIAPDGVLCDLRALLPDYVGDSMAEAITAMGRRLSGFDNGDAVLTGVETRSSSPVRILRSSETLQSVAVAGLYPCGEGAGYAGGIVSAAVDGIKCAERIISGS